MDKTSIDTIKKVFSLAMPGYEAHKLMMPLSRPAETTHNADKAVKKGGVLVLLYQKNGVWHIPLTLRHDYEGIHSGQISFPGGKWESGDKDLTDTALRETHEEIGIPPAEVKVIGALSELFIPPSNFNVFPAVGYMENRLEFVPDPYEVKTILETPLSLLMDQKTIKKKEILVRKRHKMNVPYYDINGHVVWGATAMMISELVYLLRKSGL